ncbi:UNVERIFIED_CONTAM: DNA-directed RNA polymerase subunit beta [Sesamum indicum]
MELAKHFLRTNIEPERMVLCLLPVLPPEVKTGSFRFKIRVWRPPLETPLDENSKFSAKERFNIDEFLHLANKVIDKGDAQSMEALVELKRRWVARFGCEWSRLEVEQTRLPATDTSVDSNPLAPDFRQTFQQHLRTKQQSMEIRSLKSAADHPRAVHCVRAVEKAPEFIRGN